MQTRKHLNSVIFYSILCTLSLLLTSLVGYAKKVEAKEASQVAINIFSENSGITKNQLNIKKILSLEENGEIFLRVFNMEPQGYIVVSAEDNTEPVLGYGLTASFNWEDAPPGLLFLLNEYKREIQFIREKTIKANTDIKNKWLSYTSPDYVSLKSYTQNTWILKTQWSQVDGFSQNCPLDPDTGDTCQVGCGAVALGQILHHWDCLVTPQGTCTYTPAGFSGSLTVNFSNQNYSWEDMDHYFPDSDNIKLLYDCAVSIKSDFDDENTTSHIGDVEYALENYWGFTTDGMAQKSNFTSSQWASKIMADISNFRPVYYRGDDDGDDGHALVVDGYRTTDNTFHCNWGFPIIRQLNDWFLLTDLTPDVYNFNSNQKAIFRIQPINNCFNGISGDEEVCSSNETYSVSLPSCCSASWSRNSSYLNQVGGNTGSSYTVNSAISTYCITGWVKVELKNHDGQTILEKTKYVGVNGPKSEDTELVLKTTGGSTVSFMCPNTNYNLFLNNNSGCNLSDYDWTFPSGWTPNYYYNNMFSFNTGSSPGGMVEVYASTCCNDNVKIETGYFGSGYCGSSYLLVFSPNPTSGETTLNIEPDEEQEEETILQSTYSEPAFDENAEWNLEVYDNLQNLKLKEDRLKGSSTKIQTASWNEGVYMVRVKYKDEVLTGKLVVKK
ncbi:MAG: thiol protease/hemagglutinin PrtT [Bacteroidales bacterium]|nr:thiol protease/hemagglutinin PrtT [Bacteroidales bacterium]